MYIRQVCLDNSYQRVSVEIDGIRPLAILKQVLTMFCDINGKLAEDDSELQSFILNKDNTHLDTNKYRVCMYVMQGGIERTAPLSSIIHLGSQAAITVSEIASVPVGFILYYDLPAGNELLGTEITSFAQYNYEEIATISLVLDIYENNTWLPADFRSKEDIMATIEKNKQWEGMDIV